MIAKEQLLKISELKLSGKIEKMNDAGFAEYCKLLDGFIKDLPTQDSELKQAAVLGNIDTFSKALKAVSGVLTRIHADDLAQNCLKLMNDLKSSKSEVIEAYLTYLLTAMSMLSIDLQMLMHGGETSGVTDEPVIAKAPEARQKNVLAVDDVSLTLTGLKMILQNTEYKLTGVNSGDSALRFLNTHRPDLFILDIEMPTMDGYELAKIIRERGHTAPIIFLTGNATQDYVLKAIQAGAADFIVKPVSKDFVLEKIRKHIG